MPMIIYSLFAVIYFAFYLHDYCRIQNVMNSSLHKAVALIAYGADLDNGEMNYGQGGDEKIFWIFSENKEKEELINRYLEMELSKGLFLTKVTKVHTEFETNTVSAYVSAKTRVSLMGIQSLFQGLSQIEMIRRDRLHHPSETLRQYEVILETGSEIKGTEQIKKKLEDLLTMK